VQDPFRDGSVEQLENLTLGHLVGAVRLADNLQPGLEVRHVSLQTGEPHPLASALIAYGCVVRNGHVLAVTGLGGGVWTAPWGLSCFSGL
jgi:hypothetical protein